jgi:hypothetical protein
MKGWYRESGRHSLAARGIPTAMRARGDGRDSVNQRNKSCAERIDAKLAKTIENLRRIWGAHCGTPDPEGEYDEESFYDYGLSFDYVMPYTFDDEQHEGYFRYQLSYGGPSDEFRFYVGPEYKVYRIEYVFMDWFDGAKRTLRGDDHDLLREVFQEFVDVGIAESEYDNAREDQ